MRKRKFDSIKLINRTLNKAIDKYGRALAPKRQRKASSFFDTFMDELTFAPKRRR